MADQLTPVRTTRPARLEVELVPEPCWWSNVRSVVDPPVWDRLRRQTYRQARYRCEICGGRGPQHPVEAHEVWAYDDLRHVQRLERLIALCPACHEVKHLGLAHVRGVETRALAHLARVNGWPPETVTLYTRRAFRVWELRSEHQWTLDLDGLGAYLSDHAELRGIQERVRLERERRVLERFREREAARALGLSHQASG
jgi:5-methylcytosine-specific restriction endonuclease McrA